MPIAERVEGGGHVVDAFRLYDELRGNVAPEADALDAKRNELAGGPMRLTINGIAKDPDTGAEIRLFNTITVAKGASYDDLFGKDGAYISLLRSAMGEMIGADGRRIRNARRSKLGLAITSVSLSAA